MGSKIAFIAAVYNEENEVIDLILHVAPHINGVFIVDDGSTDKTFELIDVDGGKSAFFRLPYNIRWRVKTIPHTGLPETVKAKALDMVKEDVFTTYDWVLMLDADERFITPLSDITAWIASEDSKAYDYVYFDQYELIDGNHVRSFQKCKLFKPNAIKFPLNDIHKDDELIGNGGYFGWKVAHRKTTNKQIQRELEYLQTYDKLLDEGHIDEGRRDWLRNLHHYVKEHHG